MRIKRGLLWMAGAGVLLLVVSTNSHADSVGISLNTSAIASAANLYLEFQLDDGNGTGDANNTFTISGLTLGGGSVAAPTYTAGGVTDAGTISLTDNSFFNDIILPFVPGALLDFNLTYTANSDTSGQDLFTFGIDSGSPCPGSCSPVADSNTNFNPVLLELDLPGAGNPAATLLSGSSALGLSAPTFGPVIATPEPGSLLLLSLGLAALAFGLMRKRLITL